MTEDKGRRTKKGLFLHFLLRITQKKAEKFVMCIPFFTFVVS